MIMTDNTGGDRLSFQADIIGRLGRRRKRRQERMGGHCPGWWAHWGKLRLCVWFDPGPLRRLRHGIDSAFMCLKDLPMVRPTWLGPP